jgi:PAS domain S-box-containing protein
VWIHHRGRLITRTNDDKPLIISGTNTDINIRKINDNALKESENRFRNMFEKHSAVMLLIESESGQIVDANASATNFYGYNQSTMCSMNISSINMMPENEIFEMRNKAMFEKQNLFEFPHRLSNGEIRQVEVDSSPIEYRGKSILFSIIHDITERKQYEKALLVQHDLSLLMGSSNNINEALEQILDAAMQLESIDCGGIYLVSQNKELDLIAQRGLSTQFLADNSHYSVDSPQSVIVNAGVAIYSTYENIIPEAGKSNDNEGLLALAVVPVSHDGELLAVLNLSSHTHKVIPLNTRNTIETITSQMGSIIMRLQMHVALQDSQQNLQALFDTVDDLLFVLDENGNIVQANNIVYESLGYTAEELMGKNILATHPLERREEAAVIVADMLSGKRDSCPVPLQAKDGALIPVETRVTKGVWGGKPALFGISRDMTERNIAKNAMEKQNLRLESVIDGTHIGTWEWNVQTGETDFNELWAQMFGYTLDELMPISIKTWENLVHPDDLKISDELLQQHFDNKLPYYEFDCRMKHKDGHWVWINDHGRVMTRTADGKPLMMFGTHTDIYKHKKIEEDVKKAMRDIRTLKGIVPICANCKKIRDDHGFWTQVEVYIRDHTEAEFSHGICPDCMDELYPGIEIDDD